VKRLTIQFKRLRCKRGLLAATALAAAALLSACGPGEGGTGGSSTAAVLAAFGAQTSSVCSAELGLNLGCSGGTLIGTASSAGATANVVLVDGSTLNANLVAVLVNNDIQLVARCTGLDFQGTWGQRTGEEPRYFGTVLLPGSPVRELATLSVSSAVAGSGGQTFVLRAANGAVLFGPVVLRRVDVAPGGAPVCG
jgi:hypothetical protein